MHEIKKKKKKKKTKYVAIKHTRPTEETKNGQISEKKRDIQRKGGSVEEIHCYSRPYS